MCVKHSLSLPRTNLCRGCVLDRFEPLGTKVLIPQCIHATRELCVHDNKEQQ